MRSALAGAALALAGSLGSAVLGAWWLARDLPLTQPLERLYAAIFLALAGGTASLVWSGLGRSPASMAWRACAWLPALALGLWLDA
ncbi:protein fptB [Pseudomonas mangiferae]|uniref:Protein fptB n=1 Tax=Pseudomonas mangiferae TaxID=2593654 RepID=A0A553GYA6_9PSED|nr:protein fptB [Pseudomonas mangiferae]TRX74483.1 protein fptB [Pseudomonas mangiferae]